ncbi:MAG: cytochrome c family protein [Candidatus Marinimicrobia bacterium]|nr:cytochrome c family protein [Candidatus Neomarinimicrobiota bacterium]
MKTLITTLLLAAATIMYAGDFSFQYVSTKTCKMCHKSAKKGNQYGQWLETGHAKAMESLKTEAAAKIATEKGLEKPAYESGECLVCHVTGWGQEGGYQVLTDEFIADEANARAVKKNDALASVGCEMCHGAGKGYKSKKIMTGIFDGTIKADSVGFMKSTEETCKTCHNEKSPNFKEFDFEASNAKVIHPYPEGFRK